MLSSENNCSHFSNLSTYHHLTELNLSNLQLTKIDRFPFEHFPNIRSLDLSSNQLTIINPDWSKFYENSIENLNLSQNKLETLLFLKDFKHLKILNITNNLLRNNERFLSLYICPTIEHLIDFNQEQIENDRLKFQQLLKSIDGIQDDQNRQMMMEIIEKQEIFFQFHLSPLGNYFLENKINKFQILIDDFDRSMNIQEKSKILFQPMKFLRSHHQSNDDLITTLIHMCAFEPNTINPILATCGGQKVCFIDCHTCEITHLFEVSTLRSTTTPANRKNKTTMKEYFSCLCWIEIEDFKILAVGATNGHVYLLSPKHKLMFGQIELPVNDCIFVSKKQIICFT
jgi:Leucine-rich repeat (LRR) protein